MTLLFILLLINISSQLKTEYMKPMLDDMMKYYGQADSTYNQTYFDQLTECLVSDGDDKVLVSQDAAWKGMLQYFDTNGTDKDSMGDADHWGGCTEFSADVRCTVAPYMRNKSDDFGSGRDHILIEEPCNYVSNIAYFHSTTRICDYPNWSISSDEVKA